MNIRNRNLGLLLVAAVAASGCDGTIDWWLTADQQGSRLYQQQDYARSARAYENRYSKGRAFYAAQEFASAAALLDDIQTPEAQFYLGNAFAQQDQLADAVAAYERALALRPDFDEATFNLEWVAGLLKIEQTEYDDAGGTGGKLKADKFVYDDKAQNAQSEMTDIEAKAQGLSQAQLEEMWMRRVQTTPGDFLEIKFAYQLASGEEEP